MPERNTISPTKIFPWSRSSQIDDKLFYEQNVSNLIRQVVDNNFVISGDIEKYQISNDEPLLVNIYGYYIEIPSNTSISSSEGNLYLKINLSGNDEVEEITQNSEDPIEIVTEEGIKGVDPRLYLQICDNAGNLPYSSRIKFQPTSLNLLEIDGWHNIPVKVDG